MYKFLLSVAVFVTYFMILPATVSVPQQAPDQMPELDSTDDLEKKCVCMNWRNCQGIINSNVPCPQSYIQVCCVQPDSRSIPLSNLGEEFKVILV